VSYAVTPVITAEFGPGPPPAEEFDVAMPAGHGYVAPDTVVYVTDGKGRWHLGTVVAQVDKKRKATTGYVLRVHPDPAEAPPEVVALARPEPERSVDLSAVSIRDLLRVPEPPTPPPPPTRAALPAVRQAPPPGPEVS
jgi:hypothetical protein